MIEYQLVSDNSGHSYIIPYDKVDDFEFWLDSVDAADGCEPPDWCVRVNGPHAVVFKEWREV